MPRVTQVCYTTHDIEATARDIVANERVGPFYFAEFPQHDLVLNGKPVSYDPIKVGFGYLGSLQYELSGESDSQAMSGPAPRPVSRRQSTPSRALRRE